MMDGVTGPAEETAPKADSGGKRASKTVADIWAEVQVEQKKFNNIVRVMVGLLIVAAIVAAALAIVTYMRFTDIKDNYDDLIANAEVHSRLNAGDGVRQQQRMVNELLLIREDSEAQRAEAQLTRQVDQVMAASAAGSPLQSMTQLKVQALDSARDHLLGHRLNLATSYLVSSVYNAPGNRLSAPEAALMNAALTDWQTPTGGMAAMETLIASSDDPKIKGYGHTGLAQIHYAMTDAVDNAGGTDNCVQVIQEVNTAAGLGVEGMVPYLWKGECMRDAGREKDAFDAFASAMRAGNVDNETLGNRRLAAHGAGTTLIARAARAPNAQLSEEEIAEVFMALAPIESEIDGVKGAADTQDPLAAAFALLNYAADLRFKRGEGEIGKIYTAENIGFVYVLSKRWEDGLKHAQAIDKVIPMAWNLTVLHICAQEMADTPGISNEDRAKYVAEAERARRTLSLMEHRRFGETELKKLLPVEYDKLVDDLVKPARDAMEAASANSISYSGD